MSRRVSLPGADELFRTTGGTALQSSSPAERRRNANGEPRVPAPAGESDPAGEPGVPGQTASAASAPAPVDEHSAAGTDSAEAPRSRTAGAEQAANAVKGRRTQETGGPGPAPSGG
ncbi:hypothetical protein AB0H70_23270, partial [Streptomyces sp. NPDC050804]